MKIVKIIISLTLLLLFSNVIQAQGKPKKSPEERAEKKDEIKQNIEKLQLSKEQETSFLEIFKRYGQKMKELRDNNLDKKEKHNQMKSLTSQKDEEMKKMLSETQFKNYQELEKEHREKRKEKRKEDQKGEQKE
jgi:periplasmic protein CpxP/Spy